MPPTTRASKVAVAGVHGGTDSVSAGTHVFASARSSFVSVTSNKKGGKAWADPLGKISLREG